jgi:hypothetical protein
MSPLERQAISRMALGGYGPLQLATAGEFIEVRILVDGRWVTVVREYVGRLEITIDHTVYPLGMVEAVQEGRRVSA